MALEQAGAIDRPKSWEDVAASRNKLFWEWAASEPAWYVVEAIPEKEFELAVSLQAAFAPFGKDATVLHLVDVYRAERRVIANGVMKRGRVIRKISRFGPLIFVRVTMTKGLCGALSNMPFAHSVMRCKDGERPVLISDAMIEFYKGIQQPAVPTDPTEIGVGDVVSVVSGPAAGQQGVVERVDSGRALRLDTSKFGGLVPLIIEASHVELVVQRRKRPIEPNVKSQAKRKRA
jgi:transcription antitermination factor NusG